MDPDEGFLLVATPQAADEHRETIVLVAVHGEEGSLGFVLNRPSIRTFAEAAYDLGIDAPPPEGPAFFGGLTRPDIGWMLFDARTCIEPDDSCLLTPEVGVTAAPDAMSAIVRAGGASLLLLGHVTWEPGDLEDEIRAGAWIRAAQVDPSLVFETPIARRWSDATCDVLGMPRPWLGIARFATA
ncbi:MAG: YqgE/AlgH family protein [Myxococcales bacterium]|nr:YqgE/AlgH family protein [Myxococcales bacterium]